MFFTSIGGAGGSLSRSMRGGFAGSSLRLVEDIVVIMSLVSLVASRAKRFGET